MIVIKTLLLHVLINVNTDIAKYWIYIEVLLSLQQNSLLIIAKFKDYNKFGKSKIYSYNKLILSLVTAIEMKNSTVSNLCNKFLNIFNLKYIVSNTNWQNSLNKFISTHILQLTIQLFKECILI